MLACLLAVVLFARVNGSLFSHAERRTFEQGATINAEVNSLTSFETGLPYEPYSLPFCKPQGGVEKTSSSFNAGNLLSGLQLYNSPYQFHVDEHETLKQACPGGSAGPLTEEQAQDIRDRIDEQYRVRLVLEGMPITVFDLEMDETNLRPGFDLGATSGKDHIVFNHLAFNVLIHKAHDAHANAVKDPRGGPQVGPRGMWEVVGLEVMPCSIQRASGEPLEEIPCKPWGSRHNPPPQIVAEGEDIVYTYDVYWEEVSQPWSGRWGLYTGDATLTRLVAMLNPLAMLAAVCVVLALLCRRVAGRDLAPPETTPLPAKEEERRRWKLVAGDVFRSPPATAALAVCVGTGVQLLCATLATLLLAAFGAFPDGHSSALPIAALTLHSCCTAVGGAAAVALLRSTQHAAAAWALVCIKTACYFPGML